MPASTALIATSMLGRRSPQERLDMLLTERARVLRFLAALAQRRRRSRIGTRIGVRIDARTGAQIGVRSMPAARRRARRIA
jgi:hypothetical protein